MQFLLLLRDVTLSLKNDILFQNRTEKSKKCADAQLLQPITAVCNCKKNGANTGLSFSAIDLDAESLGCIERYLVVGLDAGEGVLFT